MTTTPPARPPRYLRSPYRRPVLVHHAPGDGRLLRIQTGAAHPRRNQNSRSVTPRRHFPIYRIHPHAREPPRAALAFPTASGLNSKWDIHIHNPPESVADPAAVVTTISTIPPEPVGVSQSIVVVRSCTESREKLRNGIAANRYLRILGVEVSSINRNVLPARCQSTRRNNETNRRHRRYIFIALLQRRASGAGGHDDIDFSSGTRRSLAADRVWL